MLRVTLAIMVLVVAGCGTAEDEPTTTAADADTTAAVAVTTTTAASPETTTLETPATTATAQLGAECAHVVDVSIESGSDGFTIAATVASTDTGWEKYADAWQVWGPEGEVLGERILAHPHENEQPFTRRLNGVQIPGDVDEVTIAARDLVLGFCGDVFLIKVPHP
ncbi:MAG: hypothetical protein GY926_09790 [bacterium]|nr:hypothetical protein [bacterium]